MKRIIKSPAVNAVCLGLLTAFYSTIFIVTSSNNVFMNALYHTRLSAIEDYLVVDRYFLLIWSQFLAEGHQKYIAFALIAITAAVIVMLALRRRPFDEYDADRLVVCLIAALVITIIAIALFYLSFFFESHTIVENFTLFIAVHWAAVVLSDFAFVILRNRS